MGAIMNAGLSLKWINRVLGQNDFEAVNRVVEQVKPGSGGLLFLPYLKESALPISIRSERRLSGNEF